MNTNGIICLITDYGLKDRFTGIIKGVACTVDPGLKIFDLTHEITPYQVIEAAYVLADTIKFWPKGTTFTVVVDPDVGSGRKPLAVKTMSGHYIIGPDNGLFTVVKDEIGLREVREINIKRNSLPGVELSSTFHGRDIFIYTAAKLASGKISFMETGFLYSHPVNELNLDSPKAKPGHISGLVIRLEEPYGNVCTNIPGSLLSEAGFQIGCEVAIRINDTAGEIFHEKAIFTKTFSGVKPGENLVYIDSAGRIGIAKNRARFTEKVKFIPNPLWVEFDRIAES